MSKNFDASNKTLFFLSWPIFVELFLRVIIGNINVLMISNYSENAVAAVSSANQLINLTVFIYGFVTIGTQIIIAQLIGANQQHKINQVIHTAIVGAAILGLLISCTFILFSEQLLSLVLKQKEIISIGTDYLKVFGGSLIVSSLSATIIAVLRSYGKAKVALLIPMVSTIIAVLGNYIALYGPLGLPKLGVMGLGLSSAVANTIGLILACYLLNKSISFNVLHFKLKDFSKKYLMDILKYGLPSSGESLSYQASQVVVTRIVSILGANYLIAKSYVQTITQFVYLVASAIAQGNQIIIGRSVGAKEFETAEKRGKQSTLLATAITILLSILIYLFVEPIMGIFTSNQEVIQIAKIVLLVDIFLEAGRAINMVLVGSLNAAGDVKFPLFCSLIVLWLISLPFSYGLAIWADWKLVGVWLAYAIDEILRSFAMIKRWHSGIWKEKTNI